MITNLRVISIFPPSSYMRLVRLHFDGGHYGSSRSQVFDVVRNLSAYDLCNGAF